MDINPVYNVTSNYRVQISEFGDDQQIISDIVVIDRTDRGVIHAPVYQLKQDTAVRLKEGYSEGAMHQHEKPFAMLGQLSEMDKSRHMLILDSGQKVFYNYLIIVTGPVGHSGDIGIFEAGIHALVEALRLRRHGITPGAKHGLSPAGHAPHANSTPFISDEIRDLVEHMMVTRRSARAFSLSSPDSQTVYEVYV